MALHPVAHQALFLEIRDARATDLPSLTHRTSFHASQNLESAPARHSGIATSLWRNDPESLSANPAASTPGQSPRRMLPVAPARTLPQPLLVSVATHIGCSFPVSWLEAAPLPDNPPPRLALPRRRFHAPQLPLEE